MQEPNQQTPLPTIKRSPTKSGAFFLASLAIIVATLCLAAQFYFWQYMNASKSRILNNQMQLQKEYQAQVTALNTQLNNHQKMLATIQAYALSENKHSSVLLAQEAEYLITLSEFTLSYSSNVELATKLLEYADQKLQQASDPALLEIRKSVMADLTSLQAVPKVDFAGLIARLSALSEQVSSLTLLPEAPPPGIKPAAPVHATWKEKLFATFHKLKDLIVIRRLEEPMKPLPSPEQETYIVGNIRLKLSQAQWAVLHQEPMLYVQSLEEAKNNLQKYFSKNPKTNNLIQIITNLATVDIKPAFPDLSKTLMQIHNYINSASQTSDINKASPINTVPGTEPSAKTNLPRALPS